MPLNNSIQILANQFSLYNQIIHSLEKEESISPKAAHAMHVLLYMSMNMNFYKRNPSSVSENDINLLIDAISLFQGINPETETQGEIIITNLFLYLVTLYDLWIEQFPEKKDFSIITNTLYKIPDPFFLSNVIFPEHSPTTDCIDEIINFENRGEYPAHLAASVEPYENVGTISDTELSLTFESIILQYVALKSRIAVQDFISEVSPNLSDTQWPSIFETINTNDNTQLNETHIFRCLQILSAHYSDKEKFVTTFLLSYQNIYNQSCQKNMVLDLLLINLIKFFSALDKLLPPQRFAELIVELQNNSLFFLEKFKNTHSTSYQTYEACLSFYTNEHKDYAAVSQNSIHALNFIIHDYTLLNSHSYDLQHIITLETVFLDCFEKNSACHNAFESFLELLKTVNSNPNNQHQRNMNYFFLNNQVKLLQLIHIMGVEGIRYLRSYLAVTVLNLERELSSIPLLPKIAQDHFKTFFTEYNNLSVKHKITAIIKSMIILNMLVELTNNNMKIYLDLSEGKSPSEYSLLLIKILLKEIFNEINVTFTEKEIIAICTPDSLEKLVSLITASKHMSTNEYCHVYLNLLKLDLTSGNIHDFLHNTEQENSIGKEVAIHNQTIREVLQEAGINSESALRYQKTLDFTVSLKADTTENAHHKKKTEYSFSVEQWPKEKADTFFLGNAVGCCLATNNSWFEAMVQRRLDDAMLFHVAVDKATNKPAALIWLYLAETMDKKIVLIANFFNFRTKYALNNSLRLALFNGLLQFTHHYCQDNSNIHAFYMRPKGYSWNHQDLNTYSIEPLNVLDKIGGPYITGNIINTIKGSKALTQEKYYLKSLSQTNFQKFDPEKLVPLNNSVMTIKPISKFQQEFNAQKQRTHDKQWGLVRHSLLFKRNTALPISDKTANAIHISDNTIKSF